MQGMMALGEETARKGILQKQEQQAGLESDVEFECATSPRGKLNLKAEPSRAHGQCQRHSHIES